MLPTTRKYDAYRVPREPGEFLIQPQLVDVIEGLSAFGSMPESNAPDLAITDSMIDGRSLAMLKIQARNELIESACRYTNQYLSTSCLTENARSRPIVLAGHQPGLFHPGVWLKNFVLSRLGAVATPINLLIDNDTVKTPSVRIPELRNGEFRLTAVPIDSLTQPIPFESWRVRNESLFEQFGERVFERIESFVPESMIMPFWNKVVSNYQRLQNVGGAIAAARHLMERDWGLSSLELPLSHLVETSVFRRFVFHIMSHADRFRRTYNNAVADYRRFHRIRSSAHPVPDLAQDQSSVEVPFWIWTDRDDTRQRLFVTHSNGQLEFSHGEQTWQLDTSSDIAVEQLTELANQGIRIRPRALTTTMFCRLFLCDLFIHGIGGAKYDQLTDVVVSEFWGIPRAPFQVVTGTAHLPIFHSHVDPAEVRQIERDLRDLRFNPQRWLSGKAEAESLVAAKKTLLESEASTTRRERHVALEQLNLQMRPLVEPVRSELESRRNDLLQGLRQQIITESREFPFCIFSAETLRPLLDRMSKP